MDKSKDRAPSMALYEAILTLRTPEECRRFFADLCTPVEMRSMEQRFDVAVCLQQGMVYLDILERTGTSSATITSMTETSIR